MALSVHAGTFAKSTGGAPASQAVTGVGFTPKALILWGTTQTAAGIAGGAQVSWGFSDGTDDRSLCLTSEDAQGTSDTDRRIAAKAFTILDFAQTVLSECDLTSFDADGFTVNWTTNEASAYIVHYLAIGGADLTNVKVATFNAATATGNQSITGTGFQPDALLFLSFGPIDPPFTATTFLGCLGLAVSSSQRGAIAPYSENGADTTDCERYQRINQCLVSSLAGAVSSEADFVSMDADGFTINWSNAPSAADRIFYLALKGGQYFVGNETQKTSTGTRATTGVGFTPKGLLVMGYNLTAQTTPQDHNRLTVGAASGAGVESCVWTGDTDALGTSSVDMSTSITKVLQHIDSDAPAGVDAEADLNAFDGDGFTLDWTTADAVARQFLFLAMGDAADGAPNTRRYSLPVTGVG
jgi:hypothetical protein